MIVNVHMVDGRTVFQLASRKDLARVMGHEPEQEDQRRVEGFVKWSADEPRWAPVRLAYLRIRLAYLRKHSIAFVVAAEDTAASDADLPAKALAEERAAKWRERKAGELEGVKLPTREEVPT